jgi:hypothetical protein
MTIEKLNLAQTIHASIETLAENRKQFGSAVNEFLRRDKFARIYPGMDYSSLITAAANEAAAHFDQVIAKEIERLTAEFEAIK